MLFKLQLNSNLHDYPITTTGCNQNVPPLIYVTIRAYIPVSYFLKHWCGISSTEFRTWFYEFTHKNFQDGHYMKGIWQTAGYNLRSGRLSKTVKRTFHRSVLSFCLPSRLLSCWVRSKRSRKQNIGATIRIGNTDT